MAFLKYTDGGLIWKGLYKERNPTKIKDAYLTQEIEKGREHRISL